MAASLLELCRRVADACNIPRPAAVARASDPTSRRLLSCAREEIRMLAAAGDWQELRREASFPLSPGVDSYPLSAIAADIDRIVPQTCWSRTSGGQIDGPLSPQAWARDAATATGATGSVAAFRILAGEMAFTPTPASAETVVFEYVSATPVLAADGVVKRRTWEDDGDTPLLDDYLVELGMRWRFMASINLEHAQIRAAYEQERARRLARGGGAPVLSLTPGAGGRLAADQSPGIDWRIVNLPAGEL